MMIRVKKASRIVGHRLDFRDANHADAEFIFQLRHDSSRNKYLSGISSELDDQRRWLASYAVDFDQAYFIIESKGGERLGTVRLYDAQNESFCWGSWVIRSGSPHHVAIESALVVYHYALSLGFRAAHFEVFKDNVAVCRFHENFGAIRVAEDLGQYHYRISHSDILTSLRRYNKYLPSGIQVTPMD